MADWNQLYGVYHNGAPDKGDLVVKAAPDLTADAYKARIGKQDEVPELKAASDWGGFVAAPFKMSVDEFEKIVPDAKKILDNNPGSRDKVRQYLQYVAEAFRIFQIDTVEAQALFIAHGAGETVFANLNEGPHNAFE